MADLEGQMRFEDVAEMEEIPGDSDFTHRMSLVEAMRARAFASNLSQDEWDQLGVTKAVTRGVEDVLPGL